MKFLHLSDLHIGKRFYGVSLLEDQQYLVQQLVELAGSADAVLIAGDLYDKAAPSGEAVALCDRLLTGLCRQNRHVFVVSGNHDSAQRLAFASALLSGAGVHISPVYQGQVEPVVLRDEWGEVAVYLLPFLKPAYLHAIDPEAEINTANDAVAWAISHMDIDPARRNLLVAHQFVTGSVLCQSEELNIGGLDQVDAALFADFDYVALGHIHTPQQLGAPHIRYCGAPLKYSFSEAGQTKAALMVELGEKGSVTYREIPLQALREVRTLRGSFANLTRLHAETTGDYLAITLTDEEDVPQAISRLRAVYPNLLTLEYDNQRTRTRQTLEPGQQIETTPAELLNGFYERQNNRPLSDEQRKYAEETIARLWEETV